MDITIYIPTRGRSSIEHITIAEFKRFSDVKPVIVCPSKEAFHYRNYSLFQVLECDLEGIGPTRQFILEQSPTPGVVMFDDDMYFSYRPNPAIGGAGCLERIDKPMFASMLSWISTTLDQGFVHGGISARQGNQNIERLAADCIRVNNAHFFNRDVYLASGLRFDTLPVMEDFYVTLSLLMRGYPNRVAYHFCWSQRGSGAKGGCSLYRTQEVQAETAHELASIFPDYVKVVSKASDSQQGVMAFRTDVNIQWMKLWKDIGQHSNRVLRDHGVHVAIPDLGRR
jgi:hypothetical protein